MGSKDKALDKLSEQIAPSMRDAFEEYRSLSREGREKVRSSAYEVPDIQQEASLEERMDAMRDALKTTVEVLRFHKQQHAMMADAMRAIAKVTLDVVQSSDGDPVSAEEGIASIGHIILTLQKMQGNDKGTLQ